MAKLDGLNETPLVSVIINCFNGEKYLKECLDSIVNQTYQNWELIFWDNVSTDNSKKFFEEYNDKRFQYYLATNHTYLYEARDLAIKKSKGEFIAFCDVDDFWSEKKLEHLIPLFKEKSIGIVYSNQWMYDDKSKKKRKRKNGLLPKGNINVKVISEQPVTINTAIIRKTDYLNLESGFNKNYQIIGDYDFFVRISKNSLFDCVQHPLTFYRLHENNFTKKNREVEIKELEEWLQEMKNNNSYLSNKEARLLSELILYKKIIILILKRQIIASIINIIKFPNNFKKVKLILSLLVPASVLEKKKQF